MTEINAIVKTDIKDIKFDNDFGKSPLALGKFTKDQGFIGVVTILGAFVGMAMAGLPLAALVVLTGLNDLLYAQKVNKDTNNNGKTARELEREEWAEFDRSRAAVSSYHPTIETQLGAIDVSTISSPVPWQTQTPVTSKLREVVDRNNSFYVAGSKGTGKGVSASNLIRWKLEQYPNAIAIILDPKGDKKEYGYWQHERIRHFAFRGMMLDSKSYQDKIVEFLAEARNLVSQADIARGMRLFIVLDELLTLKENLAKELFNEFKRFGVEAISTGDSEGIHLIAITQSFNAGDSFGSDELLKNFTQVGLFRQDEYTRAKKLIQYGRSNGELAESDFRALVSTSPVGRVMSIAGEFIPTPTLTNHSAFDRDSGKVIKQMPLGSSPSEGDSLALELATKIKTSAVATINQPDRFLQLVNSLTHESQSELKSFVLWLGKKKGSEVTYNQIKDNWAKNNNVSRSEKSLMTLINLAKSKGLLTIITNSNYRVSEG